MTQQEIIANLRLVFSALEKDGMEFPEATFFKRPDTGKWSAAENIQHLFLSVKPLVGLFGKPELMLQQWGSSKRKSMDYEGVVNLYLEKIGKGGLDTTAFVPEGLCSTQPEQMENLKSIQSKFLERAAGLDESRIDACQIPHPLMSLLTAREFLYFTHYHTLHHHRTIKNLNTGA